MKVKIITLKDNELSERIARESIEQASKFNVSVEYFDGINGFYAEQHLIDLRLRPKKKMRVGALGCALSHIYLWRQCVQDSVPYLILEHDGYFIEPLPNNILDLFDDVLKLDGDDCLEGKLLRGNLLEDEIFITPITITNNNKKQTTKKHNNKITNYKSIINLDKKLDKKM